MAPQLESARFRGDRSDTGEYPRGRNDNVPRYGQSGEHIRAVQFALTDLGDPAYAIPSGATGFFGAETSNAVVNFKQAEEWTGCSPVRRTRSIPTADAPERCPVYLPDLPSSSIGRLVHQHRPAEPATTLMAFTDKQRQPHLRVVLDLPEAPGRVAVLEVGRPATQERVHVPHDALWA